MQLITSNAGVKPNFLVYGPAGTRKSFSITTYTKGSVHILQTEPGRISPLDDPRFYADVQAGKHAVIKMESNSDFDQIRRGGANAYANFCAAHGLSMPDMIVLDSISWYNTLVIDDVLTKFPPRNAARVPDITHWMMIVEQTRQLLMQLARTPAILYIIAQADIREIEEPGTKTTMWIPGIAGKYATLIAHAVDMVFFAKPDSRGDVQLHCTATGAYLAKTRGIAPVGKTIPFNLDHILDLWSQSIIGKEGADDVGERSPALPTAVR